MENEKIIAKIRKCLALSTSSNEHEAAAALRQAKKMMEAYGVTDLDIDAAEAQERRAKAGARIKPASWEANLASNVAATFNCKVLFLSSWREGQWVFIGCGASSEVAQYAFTVLARQSKRARELHIRTHLGRCKASTKTRRADLFSEGWVRSVSATIEAFSCNEHQEKAIGAFLAKTYPALSDLATSNRNQKRKLNDKELNDFMTGHQSGKNAQLNRGVGGAAEQGLLA
ncbi:DUF2786 domain-containing protein [Limnohabitans sp.]|uniref:DUF2786 domain-containing protein n=1 Tax=Limnohabitans sp. TaxID=1907725 RepID=UPI00286F2A1B|nr:DUF2786 domain-containing protein [Limnohabitans sp.]